ncbi:MAG TPA: hemerythrin domain-containing protein [Burkholderiales bacterium]|nr:hemerythrin domain-containing protein [Burkholderiales bacterium]
MEPFDDPLELFEACHERIERQLRTLERMVPHVAANGPDEAARSAAAAVMRYFDTAGVHHHRDEDEDLFPRLRALAARGGRDEIGAALYELGQEHRAIDSLYAALRAQLEGIAAATAARLDGDLVERFCWLQRRHMGMEAEVILPFARSALEPRQLADMGGRMAARRQPSVVA